MVQCIYICLLEDIMQEKILSELSKITEEEQSILVSEETDRRALYSRSKRFIIERRHISGISIGESTAAICMHPHPRFREFPTHTHDYIEIMYVCSGSITHVINGTHVRLDTDELIILGKDTKHSINSADHGDIGINIIISTDLFESTYNSIKKSSRLSERKIESLIQRNGLPYCVFSARESIEIKNIVENMICSTLFDKEPDGYILKQSLRLLLCYLTRLDDTEKESDYSYRDEIKKKILDYIETSYSSATLTEAAEMLGLSPSYLSRLVCSCFGVSFKELLMSARFDAAARLLSSTDMPIGDIINRVGYENSSFFHKEFKKRYSQTPNNYRRTH